MMLALQNETKEHALLASLGVSINISQIFQNPSHHPHIDHRVIPPTPPPASPHGYCSSFLSSDYIKAYSELKSLSGMV
ncbi:hypothetical protein BDW59DRAFT_138524, partial [Aspergillus cavernicola]